MAYPISQEALNLFTTPYRQVVDISFYGLRDELHLTDEDIVLGGLSVNRYCVSGNKIEIGSVVASEIEMRLNNADGRFNNILFEGAEMYVRVGTKKWDAHRWENAQYHYIPFGYFTIDEAPRKLEVITLTALDRMVLFDKPVDMSLLYFPMTVGSLLNRICEICNVTLGITPNKLPNYSYVIHEAPTSENLTYRQLLSWIAELTGTCGFIDWNGHLILKWYELTDTALTVRDRFDSYIEEKAITITGVQVSTDNEVFLEGDEGYVFNIESNELIQHDHLAVAQTLYSVLGGFSYTPFSATVMPMPHLYPLDIITFVDKNGIDYTTIITDYTFTLNASTALEGKGETATRNGYVAQNPLTRREQSVLEKLKREQNKQLENREQAMISLNETIWNSLGLRTTEVDDGTGGIIRYFHDGTTLEDSTIIYTMKAGGFAWTDEWNGEETVWQYGFTRDGNAILNILTAYKIQAEQIDAGAITAEKLSIEYRNSVDDKINASIGDVRQEFEVGFGELRSTIEREVSEEKSRAEQAEQSLADNLANGLDDLSNEISEVQRTLSSEIEQTAESIRLSVNETINETTTSLTALINEETERAENAEIELGKGLEDEVERATNAENALQVTITEVETTLSSAIEQTAKSIILSVSETINETTTTLTKLVESEEERAKSAEESLGEDIENETDRATAAEDALSKNIITVETTLSSKIEQTAAEIRLAVTSETTRAQQVENELGEIVDYQSEQIKSLSSELSITAGKIEAKVSMGDICAGIKAEVTEYGADVEITGNHLIVESDNFKLSRYGEVTATGTFSATNGMFVATLSGGNITGRISWQTEPHALIEFSRYWEDSGLYGIGIEGRGMLCLSSPILGVQTAWLGPDYPDTKIVQVGQTGSVLIPTNLQIMYDYWGNPYISYTNTALFFVNGVMTSQTTL